MEQLSEGVTQRAVAQSCDLGIRTIRRWIRARGFPERKLGDRKSTVDEHSWYLEQRWNEGCHNATQLWHELRSRGFAGQCPIVRTWVRRRYGSRKSRTGQQPSFNSPPRVSPRQTAWTLLKAKEVSEQLIIDAAKYRQHTECKTLICLMYDQDGLIKNPRGIERDLAKLSGNGLEMVCVITP
jgi:hypothetical protein